MGGLGWLTILIVNNEFWQRLPAQIQGIVIRKHQATRPATAFVAAPMEPGTRFRHRGRVGQQG